MSLVTFYIQQWNTISLLMLTLATLNDAASPLLNISQGAILLIVKLFINELEDRLG